LGVSNNGVRSRKVCGGVCGVREVPSVDGDPKVSEVRGVSEVLTDNDDSDCK